MKKLDLAEALGDWYLVLQPLLGSTQMMYIGQILGRDIDILQPKLENVFRALKMVPPDKVKAVILGQDPYPGGHANGLAFGSGNGQIPYSLGVIMDELKREYQKEGPIHFDITLERWADQGVLLLNRTLTTIKGAMNYHYDIGWDVITGTVLRHIARWCPDVVFMAWGSYAKDTISEFVAPHLSPSTAAILRGPHPSAQRHGYAFIGCGHFRKCNDYLVAHNKTSIQWIND